MTTTTTTGSPLAPDDGAVRLRARDPADLLLLVPYLLGYHPHESLVVTVLEPPHRGGTASRFGVSARIDLPGPGPVEPLLAAVLDVVRRQRAEEVLLHAWGGAHDACARLVTRVTVALREDGVAVRVAACTDGFRWWPLTHSSTDTTTDRTTDERAADDAWDAGFALDAASSAVVAEAVLAGCVVRGDRAAVEASVSGPDPAACPRLRERLAGMPPVTGPDATVDPVALMRTELDAGLSAVTPGPGPGPAEDRLLRLAVLASHVRARDAALAAVTRHDASRHAELWQRVVAVAPPELAVEPLCLLGVAGWQRGDGTLLHCCVERALGLDPTHRLAGLLDQVQRSQLSPDCWAGIALDVNRRRQPADADRLRP